jgi:hypothetical protein
MARPVSSNFYRGQKRQKEKVTANGVLYVSKKTASV